MTTDLTTRIAELASLIETRLAEDEATARACADSGGSVSWWDSLVQASGDHTIRTTGNRPVARIRLADSEARDGRTLNPDACATHIPRHDPARVLRRVKAARFLLAAILAEPHDWIPGGEFYSCSQAVELNPAPDPPGEPGSGCTDPDRAGKPCDCGRDARVARLLGIIASEWETT